MSLLSYPHQLNCPASTLRQPGVDPECTCPGDYIRTLDDEPIISQQAKAPGIANASLHEQSELDKLRHRLLVTIKVAEQQQNAIKAALRYPNLIAFMGKQLFDLLEEAAGLSLNTEPQELVDLIKHRVDAGITSQYNPEFGTEWREPDGRLFRLFHEAQRQSWKEAKEEVRRLFADESLKHYNREEMETIILGNLNRLTPPELES
jgi:hypothetical protein